MRIGSRHLRFICTASLMMGILCIQAAGGVVIENFATDPTSRGWTASSGATFAYNSTDQNVTGLGLQRDVEQGYYVSLGSVHTQDSTFSARADVKVTVYESYKTGQVVNVGFFDKNTWFTPATQNSWDVTSTSRLAAWLYDNQTGDASRKNLIEAIVNTPNRANWDLRGNDLTPVNNGAWLTLDMKYNPNGGTGYGQFTVTAYALGDFGGTKLYDSAINLAQGDTFAVDAFGIFTGRTNAVAVACDASLDNVLVVPEPLTTSIALVGFAGFILRKRK